MRLMMIFLYLPLKLIFLFMLVVSSSSFFLSLLNHKKFDSRKKPTMEIDVREYDEEIDGPPTTTIATGYSDDDDDDENTSSTTFTDNAEDDKKGIAPIITLDNYNNAQALKQGTKGVFILNMLQTKYC